jgi:hypothetical protein
VRAALQGLQQQGQQAQQAWQAQPAARPGQPQPQQQAGQRAPTRAYVAQVAGAGEELVAVLVEGYAHDAV